MANLSNITNQSAAPQIVATGTLAAGQTDIGLSVSFPVNQYPSAQIGAVLVYVNGQLLLRNTGNATASLTADGNYQEVDAGSGFSSLIRLNVADPLNARPYAIISNGFNVAQPSTTIQSQIQTLQTQQDNMALTLAEVAGVAVSTLYTPLNDATRATFASQFTTLQSDAALKNVSNTFTQPQLIPGRTDGASIPAGIIGETTETVLGPTAAAVTNTPYNIGSISVGAGVWLIYGQATFSPGTVTGNTATVFDLSTTSATFRDPANVTRLGLVTTNSGTQIVGFSALPLVVNSSGSTTVFAIGQYNFATLGTSTMRAVLRAVRIA